ncbi:MAG: cyclic pyranopterin monophosphate synthase MoaC [Candidatus Omnitrophica bacterium]|nr:cyclic pyranopterin monophosphate synthase MoaC [Candidatus Omnitrophota bacterium]
MRGQIRMADVSAKPATVRKAAARCELVMKPATLKALRAGRVPKGEVIPAAQAAGILAAKQTAHLIPLCHPIPVSQIQVRCNLTSRAVVIESEVITTAPTGPEMEAMTAAAVAALTVYDMLKGLERGIVIRRLLLTSKSGGKSGTWRRG